MAGLEAVELASPQKPSPVNTSAVLRVTGEAMDGTDHPDHDMTRRRTAETTRIAPTNAVHLARLRAAAGYPA